MSKINDQEIIFNDYLKSGFVDVFIHWKRTDPTDKYFFCLLNDTCLSETQLFYPTRPPPMSQNPLNLNIGIDNHDQRFNLTKLYKGAFNPPKYCSVNENPIFMEE